MHHPHISHYFLTNTYKGQHKQDSCHAGMKNHSQTPLMDQLTITLQKKKKKNTHVYHRSHERETPTLKQQ